MADKKKVTAEPTATLRLRLKSSTGYAEEGAYANVTVAQWSAVSRILNGGGVVRTVKFDDCELVEFDADLPDGEYYLVPVSAGVGLPPGETK